MFFLFFCWRKLSRRAHELPGGQQLALASFIYAEDLRRKIRREFRYKPEQPHHNRGIRRNVSIARGVGEIPEIRGDFGDAGRVSHCFQRYDTGPTTQAISPFFIVSNVDQTIAFYRDKLGFEVDSSSPIETLSPSSVVTERRSSSSPIKTRRRCRPREHPRLHIENFPSYAPELNPDEGVGLSRKRNCE